MPNHEDEDDTCPHCDLVRIFLDYRAKDWEGEAIIGSFVQGLASMIAASTPLQREYMLDLIIHNMDDFVDEAGAGLILHNLKHRVH
jgi:hypothetical protein|tara:strand:+ start:2815 stop:3072 length:258 start_codon:yes stop_codon:yes gene_type:complete